MLEIKRTGFLMEQKIYDYTVWRIVYRHLTYRKVFSTTFSSVSSVIVKRYKNKYKTMGFLT